MASSVPQNKQELLAAIQSAFDKLILDYQSIPETQARLIGVEGNIKDTEVSVCDTLAYLIGWGRLVLKWYDRKSKGLAVDFPETGYKWNELGGLAVSFHQQYQHWAYSDLQQEFRKVVAEIVALIESLSNEDLYGSAWYEKYPLGRMIQFNTSSPMKNMRSKVRRFKKQQKA